jgi:hypothetical protein
MTSRAKVLSDNAIRCNLRLMGTYAKVPIFMYKFTYYFISVVPANSNERCFKPVCHGECTLTYCRSQTTFLCSVYVLSETLALFLSLRARPTHDSLWQAQLIPTEELVIFLFAVTLAERTVPAPGFAVVNIGLVCFICVNNAVGCCPYIRSVIDK